MSSSAIRYNAGNRNEQLTKYLNEIAKHKLLNAGEEAELAIKIRSNDADALEKLINANLRFVVSIARQYQSQNLSLNDLINEGNLGLIHAARKFDETKGFKFITYAVWAIRRAILQAIADQSRLVRVPGARTNAYAQLNSTYQKFEQEHHCPPNVEELFQASGMSKDEVHCYFRSTMHSASAECTDNIIHYETLAEANEPCAHSRLDQQAVAYNLAALIETLPDRDREIITGYFGLYGRAPMTLEELGKEFGITREGVRKVKERCMSRLKPQISPCLMHAYF